MITLEAAGTLRGRAGTPAVISYTIFGDEISGSPSTDAFKVLGQGQLGTGIATLDTVPGSTQALIKEIHLAETSGVNVSGVMFYINGSSASNKITGSITIPANGTAIYDGKWNVFDAAGVLQYVGSTG